MAPVLDSFCFVVLSLPKHKKEAGDYTGAVAIIDACRPYHWIDEFPRTTKIN